LGQRPVGPVRGSALWLRINRPNHRRRSSIDEPAPSAWLAPVTAVLNRLGARWALDEAYIEHWAGEWNLLDRWDEMRRTR
jgi:hypothetical protein